LIGKMTGAAQGVESARPIYLDPLDERIPLEAVFQESAVRRIFDGQWQAAGPAENRLLIPVGFQDSPQECIQKEMEVDFDDQDGHLWIVGAAGSGKAMTLETILLSLALTHTPAQAWFYILEFGAGRLFHFECLPHCGAVIRSTDPVERLDKLLNFLDEEMDRRMAKANKAAPAIFLVINNFAEMRANYPDHAERVSRYARDGKAVGLHLIITTNRGLELSRIVIARRIVLQMAKRDEYMDVIGRAVSLPSIQAEGRGLWVERQTLECQIAQPQVQFTGQEALQDVHTICEAMRAAWKGPQAHPIRVLSEFIPFEEVMGELEASGKKNRLPIPAGVSFESLELVAPQMLREIPRWLVIGPPRSGKSNFLGVLARAVLAQAADDWELYYFSLRRSPPEWTAGQDMQVVNSLEASVQTCTALMEKAKETSGQEKGVKKTLLLLDDLGAAFEPGKESLAKALNDLALVVSAREDFFIAAAGAADELRSQQVMSPLVRGLKQARTGIGFSKDPNDMDILGAPVALQYRRIDLPPGRGFWVSAGKAVLVQTPCLGGDELE
jgi:S-DNA-T family DNA segregation ATPase FtsK/SpoIIIE